MTKGNPKSLTHLAVTCFALLLCLPTVASAQRVEDSCHAFFTNIHQAFDCTEALFTQTDIPYHLPHLTLSSIPPGNGMPIGVVYEKRTHYVTSPYHNPNDSVRTLSGYKSIVDATAAIVSSTNGSWYATGAVTWLPPIHYRNYSKVNGNVCHRLWVLCTTSVMGIKFYITHRSLQTINFYGLGPSSPNRQLTYRESETYGGAMFRMPLLNSLAIQAQVENRKPSINFNNTSIDDTTISEATAPGLTAQPDFMHYAFGLTSRRQAISEPVTNDPSLTPPGASPVPLMKHKLVFIFQNSAIEHWYRDQDNGYYSFRQFTFDGDESVKIHSVIRRFVPPTSMTTKLRILKHFCNQRVSGLKVGDECDLGELSVRPLLVLSTASSGTIPFYFQPTLGGSDIESRLTLRGFDNYRFRAKDAAMVGVDYRIPVFQPIGALLFYDVGNVGDSVDELSLSHARQDGGVGATLNILNNVVAQVYLGFGAGHGSHFGYNFTKFF